MKKISTSRTDCKCPRVTGMQVHADDCIFRFGRKITEKDIEKLKELSEQYKNQEEERRSKPATVGDIEDAVERLKRLL